MNLTSIWVTTIQATVLLTLALTACIWMRKEPQARLIICRAALVSTILLVVCSPWFKPRPHPLVAVQAPAWTAAPSLVSVVRDLNPTPIHAPRLREVPVSTPSDTLDVISNVSPISLLIAIWGCGAAILTLFLAIGYFRLWVMRRRTLAITSGPLANVVGVAAADFGVAAPEIRAGSLIPSPFVTGVLRPTLFVPSEWQEFSEPEMAMAVCRHEMAHLAFHDLHWSLGGRITSILFWPHPLVWILTRTASIASEEACDRRVLALGCSPEQYATCLLDLKESPRVSRDLSLVGLGAASNRSSFGKRIEAIMEFSSGMRSELSRLAVRILVGCCAVVALIAATVIAKPNFQLSQAQASVVTLSNLKQVTLGVLMYANDYDNVMPYVQSTRAVQFVTYPYLHGAHHWVPTMGDVKGHLEPVSAHEVWKTHNPSGGDFVFNMAMAGAYCSSMADPANMVLMNDSKEWPDGRRAVAFCDGHVKLVDATTWQQLSMKLKSFQVKRVSVPLPADYGAKFDLEKMDSMMNSPKTTPAVRVKSH